MAGKRESPKRGLGLAASHARPAYGTDAIRDTSCAAPLTEAPRPGPDLTIPKVVACQADGSPRSHRQAGAHTGRAVARALDAGIRAVGVRRACLASAMTRGTSEVHGTRAVWATDCGGAMVIAAAALAGGAVGIGAAAWLASGCRTAGASQRRADRRSRPRCIDSGAIRVNRTRRGICGADAAADLLARHRTDPEPAIGRGPTRPTDSPCAAVTVGAIDSYRAAATAGAVRSRQRRSASEDRPERQDRQDQRDMEPRRQEDGLQFVGVAMPDAAPPLPAMPASNFGQMQSAPRGQHVPQVVQESVGLGQVPQPPVVPPDPAAPPEPSLPPAPPPAPPFPAAPEPPA